MVIKILCTIVEGNNKFQGVVHDPKHHLLFVATLPYGRYNNIDIVLVRKNRCPPKSKIITEIKKAFNVYKSDNKI